MKLIPLIASYSAQSRRAILSTLTQQHLNAVLKVCMGPVPLRQVDPAILTDLEEMHVLAVNGLVIRLATTVFLEQDMKTVISLSSELGSSLAHELIRVGGAFSDYSPEVRNFLGGIVGISQGLSRTLREEGTTVNWRDYGGRFAQSKVDFDEDCLTLTMLGPDLQNKSVTIGAEHNTVHIGPDISRATLSDLAKPQVITRDTYSACAPVVQEISRAAYDVYNKSLERIKLCLSNTTAGRQGVPPENMMMHFWRYCRKTLGAELYKSGFLSDAAPLNGYITVTYDNSIAELNALLGLS